MNIIFNKKILFKQNLNYALYLFSFNKIDLFNLKRSFVTNIKNNKKIKKIILHPEYYEFYNNKYKTDDWTNLTNNIIKYIPIKLYKNQSNPIFLITELIKNYFSDYEVFEFENPIVHVKDNFESLFIPENHSSRLKSDTYYVNKNYLLRCHTSAHQIQCIKKLKKNKFICIGDVYRKDVIDFNHFPVFHQCEIFNILDETEISKNLEIIANQISENKYEKQTNYTLQAFKLAEKILKNTVENFLKKTIDNDVKTRWISAKFPFTYPSFELEIYYKNNWIELLGCGIVKKEILENQNIYNKIAFAIGFGLERLAMIKYFIPDIRLFWTKDKSFLYQFENKKFDDKIIYKELSKYNKFEQDCSFWINNDSNWSNNDFYELAREVGGELIEYVKLIDIFKNQEGKISNCFRITYRSNDRNLKRSEILKLHENIKSALVKKYGFEIR